VAGSEAVDHARRRRDWQPFTPGDPTFTPTVHRLAMQAYTIPVA
jgi:hypothetical protein